MQLLIFIIIYPLLYFVSILPFRMLYAFSDCLYFLLYRVIGYRKKVVRDNLEIALPHLTVEERLVVEKKFYSHLCDLFLEMAKTLTISNEEMEKRFVIKNLDLILELEKENKSIAIMSSHYASYEWILTMNPRVNLQGYAIYKRIGNPYFDKLVRRIRSRFGTKLITTRAARDTIREEAEKKQYGIYGFAADQSPQKRAGNYYTTFFGKQVPVFVGAEILAIKYDMNVVFLNVNKVKRGFYEAKFEHLKIDENGEKFNMTNAYLKKVEAQIIKKPEFYLWTHKRFKHEKK